MAASRPTRRANFVLRRSGPARFQAAATPSGAAHHGRFFRPRTPTQLFTRIYFAGDPLNDTDPVLLSIDNPARRETLLATPDDSNAGTWHLDIVMQGKNETVFFDI